ncbi:hypothetical protein [Pseudomonas oryzihabitans]|uniref:hypothetical protein n=1 Tax=Pseudomonas oryzihabitans TaxID=47885 RepID=UPI0028955764|nr:hypothetical protein [Pseudomonas oryzihabitans]MDT3717931.1 hypothetical protein [Pseudomonas oryzihabitans]
MYTIGFVPDASNTFKYVLSLAKMGLFGEAPGQAGDDAPMLHDPRAVSLEIPVTVAEVNAFNQHIAVNARHFPTFRFRPDRIGDNEGGNCIYYALTMIIDFLSTRAGEPYAAVINDLFSIMNSPGQVGCLQGVLIREIVNNAANYPHVAIGNIENGYT